MTSESKFLFDFLKGRTVQGNHGSHCLTIARIKAAAASGLGYVPPRDKPLRYLPVKVSATMETTFSTPSYPRYLVLISEGESTDELLFDARHLISLICRALEQRAFSYAADSCMRQQTPEFVVSQSTVEVMITFLLPVNTPGLGWCIGKRIRTSETSCSRVIRSIRVTPSDNRCGGYHKIVKRSSL